MVKRKERVAKKIICTGLVQGIGFRPSVFRLAKQHDLIGAVRNLGGIAEIRAKGTSEDLEAFLCALYQKFPLVNFEVEELKAPVPTTEFIIAASGKNNLHSELLPDIGICQKCEAELKDTKDRRYEHPFISCAQCGPRYSILSELPYDRVNTTMRTFEMCAKCEAEYSNPENRRFHAQTISCLECEPTLLLKDLQGDAALHKAVSLLKQGDVVAIKGIGGYHFACLGTNKAAADKLRELKGRSNKAFAVMFANLEQLERFCEVNALEKELLVSAAKPIVLLRKRKVDIQFYDNFESNVCGAFLPYTGLHLLFTEACGPLIMTSANYAERPIIIEDQEMGAFNDENLAGVLYHKRQIINANEDSVVKVVNGEVQLIRRGRGYAPAPLNLSQCLPRQEIWAAGSDLKAVFAFAQAGKVILSPPYGDLEERSALERYVDSYQRLKAILQLKPSLIVCDLHPGYHSVRYAHSLGLPARGVQHHHAHIASVIAEHQLEGKVLGIAYDGNGYGTDGNLWGGEFLLCQGGEYERMGHLNYTKLIGGDVSFKDADKSAYCFLLNCGIPFELIDERIKIIRAALDNNVNTILSSGMGRLFDAIASLLDIAHWNTYEGECAMLLEQEARQAYEIGAQPLPMPWDITQAKGKWQLNPAPMLQNLIKMKQTEEKGILALSFHYSLVEVTSKMVQVISKDRDVRQVALSGGVFQNSLLTELLVDVLQKQGFKVYLNNKVPPNDGGIALGQVYLGLLYQDNLRETEG